MYADLDVYGSHLRAGDSESSKVVEDLDDLSWLDQFGTMDRCVDDPEEFYDLYPPDSDLDSDSDHVEVEL